jgi:hypothetical protein
MRRLGNGQPENPGALPNAKCPHVPIAFVWSRQRQPHRLCGAQATGATQVPQEKSFFGFCLAGLEEAGAYDMAGGAQI